MLLMNDYSDPKYKDLYEEIVKDHYWTWGKFSPIPYPFLHNRLQQNDNFQKAIKRRSI